MIDRITAPTARVKKLVKWPMKTRRATGSCRPFPSAQNARPAGLHFGKKGLYL